MLFSLIIIIIVCICHNRSLSSKISMVEISTTGQNIRFLQENQNEDQKQQDLVVGSQQDANQNNETVLAQVQSPSEENIDQNKNIQQQQQDQNQGDLGQQDSPQQENIPQQQQTENSQQQDDVQVQEQNNQQQNNSNVQNQQDQQQATSKIEPTKSPNDNMKYEAIILENKLKVLLIHNDYITKSGCSLSIEVGSLYNPKQVPGLVHLIQHMLFKASKKYPNTNQFTKFIKQNSGSRSAYTSDLQCNHYIQIKNSKFVSAIDRIVSFFVSPLFSQNSVEREIATVANDDNRRRWRVFRRMAQQPFSIFTTGSGKTLNQQGILQKLTQFYSNYYSSNLINLVIYSNYTINQLKDILIPMLQRIPNKNSQLPQLSEHFAQQQIRKLIRVQSIKDQYVMKFFWVGKLALYEYKVHVTQYIVHVLGYKGINSILQILNLRRFASTLQTQILHLKSQTIISLQIKLTDRGYKRYLQVYNIVADYIQSLIPQEYIYNQIKSRNLANFQFKQKIKVPDYVREIASKMSYIPLQQILNHSVLFENYETAQPILKQYLNQLTIDNLILIISAPQKLQNAQLQQNMNIKYKVQDLPQRDDNQRSFQQIPQNPYIPINTKVFEFEKSVTSLNITQNFYLLQDSSYGVCKGGVQLRVYSPQSFQFLKFYSKFLQYLLKKITYPTQVLGSQFNIQASDSLVITLFGFSDTALKMLEIVAQNIGTIHKSQNSKKYFEIALNDIVQNLQNYYNRRLDAIADSLIRIIMTDRLNLIENSLEEIKSYQYDSIMDKLNSFWEKTKLKWIVVGNFQEQSITNIVEKIQGRLLNGDSSKIQIPYYGCMYLKDDVIFEVRLQGVNNIASCASIYYQAGPYSEQLFYKLMLLKLFIETPLVDHFKKTKKSANTVIVKVQNIRGVLGIKFTAISFLNDPRTISIQTKKFINNFYNQINEQLGGQDNTKFDTLKHSLYAKIKSPLNNLQALFQTTIKQISENTFFYTRKQSAQISYFLDEITSISLQQLWNGMQNVTMDIYLVSKAHEKAYNQYGIEANDLEDIRQENLYFNDLFYCCN